MSEYTLSPSPEWCDACPSISRQAWKGRFENPAYGRPFLLRFDSREEALAAAAAADLFPTVETYGVGRTCIRVAPPQHGGQMNATMTTRHHGARTSGVYRSAP